MQTNNTFLQKTMKFSKYQEPKKCFTKVQWLKKLETYLAPVSLTSHEYEIL